MISSKNEAVFEIIDAFKKIKIKENKYDHETSTYVSFVAWPTD